jgi:hypothetical protein
MVGQKIRKKYFLLLYTVEVELMIFKNEMRIFNK